jgi:predicted XRE-type DNA-binding protein
MKEEAYESVWDAIERRPSEAASLKVRSSLLMAIQDAVDRWDLPAAAMAQRLGVTQARLKDLRKGNINVFSLDDLMKLSALAGLTVTVDVRPVAA